MGSVGAAAMSTTTARETVQRPGAQGLGSTCGRGVRRYRGSWPQYVPLLHVHVGMCMPLHVPGYVHTCLQVCAHIYTHEIMCCKAAHVCELHGYNTCTAHTCVCVHASWCPVCVHVCARKAHTLSGEEE